MGFIGVCMNYLVWHYGPGIGEFLSAWKHVQVFLFRFFSVRVLLRTLFQPFRRIREDYGHGFDPEKLFAAAAGNMVSRMVGFLVRGVFLVIAFVAEISFALLGTALFVFFLVLPIALLVVVLFALQLMVF